MDDILNLLQFVSHHGGRLLDVQYLIWDELPNDIVSIVLNFDRAKVTITANDDDTVTLSQGCPKVKREHSLRISEDGLWLDAIGKPVLWGWLMINHQGYEDAIQLELAHNVTDIATTIQIVAIGQSLSISHVHKMRR